LPVYASYSWSVGFDGHRESSSIPLTASSSVSVSIGRQLPTNSALPTMSLQSSVVMLVSYTSCEITAVAAAAAVITRRSQSKFGCSVSNSTSTDGNVATLARSSSCATILKISPMWCSGTATTVHAIRTLLGNCMALQALCPMRRGKLPEAVLVTLDTIA
jgi:hypothetical protein